MNDFEEKVNEILPNTFYQNLPAEKRLELIVEKWNLAMVMLNKIDSYKNILTYTGSYDRNN